MSLSRLEGAACAHVDPELFFPNVGERTKSQQAKAVCTVCPVREACLDEAMAREGDVNANQRQGVLGGLNPRDRAQLAKDRKQVAQ